ncbi:uncharacterized protein LOC125228318 [Leguminivora glycinivorella]|uniref:uncharacterized protein LOC125228318 n=1 Tax=Leguminivora glycinivorella TaxID=1035111 RepID=UPI00200D741A|nr:uncharacterized protein LOC125228318 [Leguminivora glycinivorella]
MFSKLYSSASAAWRPAFPVLLGPQYSPPVTLAPRAPRAPRAPLQVPARRMNLGLTSQYSNNRIPDRLRVMYAMKHYYETIPLFVVCIFDIIIVVGAILYACQSRVELQFVHKENNSISRTMDMRYPKIYKHMVHHQQCPPWPELHEALEKMKEAEKRLRTRLESCNNP